MEELTFCPKCGSETLRWDGEKKLSCEECTFVLYHNCAAAVAVIIRYEDKILLTKRNQEPAKNKLDLAGGFVDPAESAEQTCYRELLEEMSLKIDIHQLKILGTLPNVYRYKDINYNTLDVFFEYVVDGVFEVTLEQQEISEVRWIALSDIDLDDIAFESQRLFLKKYLALHS